MSIVKLSIKNFLSIADVEIEPGKVNQIHGQNNQGKTTVLKALEFAFKGSTDGSLVRHGEDAAEVVLELDEMTIRRRLAATGKQTVSVTKGGFKADSPQAFLSSLFEGMSFNPLEILNPKTRSQFILKALDLRISREELAELSGIAADDLPPLDYEKENALVVIEQAYKYFYARRAEANKKVSDKKKRYEAYAADLPKDEPPKVSRKALEDQILFSREQKAKLEQELRELDTEHQRAKLAKDVANRYQAEIEKIEKDIELLKSNFEKSLAVLEERKKNGLAALEEAKTSIPTDLPDKSVATKSIEIHNETISELNMKLKELEVYEAQQKQRQIVEDYKKEMIQAQEEAAQIDARVQALGAEAKDKIMSKAELPVEGLSYNEGEFGLNGASLDHLSSSMALRLSLALVRKLSSKTKMICIDGAELLDSETFKTLQEEMKEDDFTYFFTKVGEPFAGAEKSFEMENGNLKQ